MRALALCLALLPAPLAAHEFWIEPTDYTVAPDGMIEGFIVNGQDFGGIEVSYFPQRIARFDLILGDVVAPVVARTGDSPALNMAPLGEGLHVAVYQSSGDVVTYDNYAVFARFVEHKDFPGRIHRQHRDRALPEDTFKEAYTRYVKSLIAVGDGAGADRQVGLETELVALTNPYTDDLSGGFRVQAFYQQEPRPDAQIELFDKAPDGAVVVTYYRTDAEGIATLPVTPGHSYLVDAVVLRIPAPDLAEATGAVWESLWAQLTFGVPE